MEGTVAFTASTTPWRISTWWSRLGRCVPLVAAGAVKLEVFGSAEPALVPARRRRLTANIVTKGLNSPGRVTYRFRIAVQVYV